MRATLFLITNLAVHFQSTQAQIDTGNITDGHFFILNNGMALTGRDNGFQGEVLGKVTLEQLDPQSLEQLWAVRKSDFYPSQGPYQLRFIGTMGAFGFNEVDLELPAPWSFPVQHYWKLETQSGKVLMNSRLQYDWDETGGRKCLQSNTGNNSLAVTLVECDDSNGNQQWEFRPKD